MKRIVSLVMYIFIVMLIGCQTETTGSNEQTDDVTEPAYYHIIFHYNIADQSVDIAVPTTDNFVVPDCTDDRIEFEIPVGRPFIEWNDSPNGKGTSYKAGDTFSRQKKNSSTVLYAIWKEAVDELYYVEYNPNGGSGNMPKSTMFIGKSKALPKCAFTATGKRFAHWTKTQADTEPYYTDEQTVTNLTAKGKTVILYAQWKDKTDLYITYHDPKNADNSGNPATFLKTDDVTLTGLVGIPGWTFGGWYDNESLTGSAITGWSAGDKDDDVELWAKWVANTYIAQLDDAGGTGGDGTVNAEYDSVLPNVAVPTRSGFAFGGYYDMQDGQGNQYIDSNGHGVKEWSKPSDGMLYAKWTEIYLTMHSITYHDPQSVTNPNPAKFAEEEAFNLQSLSKPGYTFVGWYDNSECTGETVIGWTAGAKTADVELWAKWTENAPDEYTIIYRDKGDTEFSGVHGSGYPQTHTAGTPTVLVSPTKTGCTFEGWYADADCTGSKITTLGADEYHDTITLYAKWILMYGINDDGNFVINGTVYNKTSFVKVMNSAVTVTGSNDNWNSYISNSSNILYTGVFIAGRNVRLSPYSICKYEVTQQLYEAVMNAGKTYDKGSGDAHPAYYVSWYDAITFCNKLSLLLGLTPCYSVNGITDWSGLIYDSIPTENNSTWNSAVVDMSANGYRLPTEAEWEFAARGGDQSKADWKYAFSGIDVAAGNKIYNGSTLLKTDDNLATVGWYTGNSESQIHSVGAKTANRLGLFDMSGNDKEWCWDWHQNNTVTSNDTAYTSEGVIVNPLGVSSGYIKVNDTYDGYFKEARGGLYTGDAYLSCISSRGGGRVQDRYENTGFRIAQTVTE